MDFPTLAMAESEVALSNYTIDSFKINSASSELRDASRTLSLETSYGEVVSTANDKSCEILLGVYVGGAEFTETKDSPLQMHIRGTFKSPVSLSDATLLEHIVDYGLQELYAIAKASLATLTSGTPTGRIVLPSVKLGQG